MEPQQNNWLWPSTPPPKQPPILTQSANYSTHWSFSEMLQCTPSLSQGYQKARWSVWEVLAGTREVMETHGSVTKGADRGQDSSICNHISPGCHRPAAWETLLIRDLVLPLSLWRQREKESPIHLKNRIIFEYIKKSMLTCFPFVSCDYEVGNYVENSK